MIEIYMIVKCLVYPEIDGYARQPYCTPMPHFTYSSAEKCKAQVAKWPDHPLDNSGDGGIVKSQCWHKSVQTWKSVN